MDLSPADSAPLQRAVEAIEAGVQFRAIMMTIEGAALPYCAPARSVMKQPQSLRGAQNRKDAVGRVSFQALLGLVPDREPTAHLDPLCGFEKHPELLSYAFLLNVLLC